jgi:hypothetical protein
MPLEHGWQHLFVACKYVASSGETPQRRLATAVESHIVVLKREHLPDQYCWERVAELVDATTRLNLKEGKRGLEVDTAPMTSSDAAKWLGHIVCLFGDVAEAYGAKIRPAANARMAAAR